MASSATALTLQATTLITLIADLILRIKILRAVFGLAQETVFLKVWFNVI
jgi:hypothetical protein